MGAGLSSAHFYFIRSMQECRFHWTYSDEYRN